MAVPAAHAGDIILNGDFADGKTHWRGDGEAPDVGGRVLITLKPDKWTVITQTFNANASALKLKVTYSLSSDCTLGKTGDKLIPPLTPDGLQEASGLENAISPITTNGRELFTTLVLEGGWMCSENAVLAGHNSGEDSSTNPAGSKTFTTQVTTWSGVFDDANLCICFPPGQGVVTLTGVVLTPPGQ
jgi:hypothetical protein